MPKPSIHPAAAIWLGLTALSWPAGAATIVTGVDEQAGLPYWEIRDAGMSLRLVQRLPDQSRGYFMARGFSAEQAERIAQSCVFQSVFKNLSSDTGPSVLRYDLGEWIVRHGSRRQGMKTREDWQGEWERLDVSQPARIAFEWSLLPTEQIYRPGDYNWGMSIFNLKPGAGFDLEIVWYQHGEQRSALISGMECAPDIHPDPRVVQ